MLFSSFSLETFHIQKIAQHCYQTLLPSSCKDCLQEQQGKKKNQGLRTRLLKNSIFVQLNFVFPIGGVFGSDTDTKNMFCRKASNYPPCPKHMETPVPILQQTKAHRAQNFPNISKQRRFPTQNVISPPPLLKGAVCSRKSEQSSCNSLKGKQGQRTIYKRLFVVIYHTCLFLCMK